MANHKSAEKRIKQTIKKAKRNRYYKTRVKNITNAFEAAIQSGDKAKATEVFKTINQNFHKYVSKGIYKKNTVARRVSRLNKQLNNLS